MDSHEDTLKAAHEKTSAALKKKPTVDNIKAAEAAERALAAYRARSSSDPAGRRFKNLSEVSDYLQGEGWKVSQAKVYDDKHKIAKEKDGSITRKAADRYAADNLEKLDGSDQDPNYGQKAKLENEILEQKKRKLQRENEIEEGKWILKSEAEQKHTAKLGLLLTAFDNFVQGGKLQEAADIIKGDRAHMAEFKAFVTREIRAMLAEYARRPVFTVPKQAIAEAEELIKEVKG